MILRLLGSAMIEGEAGPLSGAATHRPRLALLARLAVAGPRGLSRDKLIALLWPESPADRARPLLSDSIYRINRAVGAAGAEAVVAWGDQLRLDPEILPSDVAAFEAALAAGDHAAAVDTYGGPFLDGFFLDESTEFDHWAEAERERLARACGQALEALAEAAELAGDHRAAIAQWRRLAALDPMSSRVALRVVQALAAAGDHGAARQHARAHQDLLRREWGEGPAEEFTAAYSARLAAREPPGAALPSVAVLPFTAIGSDPDAAAFGHGITEDVIANLARLRGLRAVSLASAVGLRDSGLDRRQLAEQLGVDTLLEGSVRWSGARVRIVVGLVVPATGEHRWAGTWDRELTDIFAIQAEVALKIATALEAELSADERARLARKPTPDLRAYHYYLLGRHAALGFDPPGVLRAVQSLERAIACDPGFAPAHASLAMMLSELGEASILPAHEAYPRARAAAAEAIRLDPELAEGHAMASYVKMAYEFDWAGAEAGFRHALELSPGSADTCDFYGRLCAGLGRFDEAITLLLRARELDPLTHRTDIATAYIRAGRLHEAETAIREVLAVEPEDARATATLGWALMGQGRTDEAIATLERAVTLAPSYAQWLSQLGQAYGMVGRADEARAILGRLESAPDDMRVSPYQLAYVLTGLGEHDRAMDRLEEALENRTGPLYSLRGSFLFAPLRGHPRYRALLARMGHDSAATESYRQD